MGIFESRKYSRKVGAIAWPSMAQPAFALVMNEEVKESPKDPKALWMIAEQEDHNLVRLLKWCRKQAKKHKLDSFRADTSNDPMVDFLHSQKLDLYLSKAPFCDHPNALHYFVSLIKVSTQPEMKILHFESSVIPSKLVATGDRIGASAEEFPALAACGYALAVLTEEYVANPRVEVGMSDCGMEYGYGFLNSQAGHYLMDDTPTAQQWKGPSGGDW